MLNKEEFSLKWDNFLGLKDDCMGSCVHNCGLTNQFHFIFSNGKFWDVRNPLWDAGAEPALQGSFGPCCFLLPSPASPILGDTRPRPQEGLWDGSNVPGSPTLGETTNRDAKLARNLQNKKIILSGKQKSNSLQVGKVCIAVWFLAAQTYLGASFSLSSTAGCLYRLLAVYIRSIHRTGCLYQTSNKFPTVRLPLLLFYMCRAGKK